MKIRDCKNDADAHTSVSLSLTLLIMSDSSSSSKSHGTENCLACLRICSALMDAFNGSRLWR